ncbi:MAG: diaminopropionate ammonia-lyase, partial [Aestuariivirgaceae bacterium]
PLIQGHIHCRTKAGPYPAALESVLPRGLMREAQNEIAQWPGYAPTTLHSLNALASELQLGAVYYKDEGERFGLASFKALGGAFAILKLLQHEISQRNGSEISLASIRNGEHAEICRTITVASATAGNHGRSLAWGAQLAGCPCKIFIHAGVGDARKQAMEALGAEVIRVDGNYDDSVHYADKQAKEHGWFIVSDTSYPGYLERPREIMAGYTVMAREVVTALRHDLLPTHIFLQTGCGGLAGGLAAGFWAELGANCPRIVIVEPADAACLAASARNGRATAYHIENESMMLGLSCGEVSILAWDILELCAADYLTISDDGVPPAMRLLATGAPGGQRVVGGESGVAGLAALIDAAQRPNLRSAMHLDSRSRVLLIGSEGATSPDIYQQIVGHAP